MISLGSNVAHFQKHVKIFSSTQEIYRLLRFCSGKPNVRLKKEIHFLKIIFESLNNISCRKAI